MNSHRTKAFAVLACASLLPLACSSKKKKGDDPPPAPPAPTAEPAPVATPETPAATTPAAATPAPVDPTAVPQALIGRVSMSSLAQSAQVTADFSASLLAPASITTSAQAAQAFDTGRLLKFTQPATTTQGTLEAALRLTGGLDADQSYALSGDYGCGCGWSFPNLGGIDGFVSNGSLVFGYGYGSYSYGGGSYVATDYGYSQTNGYYDPRQGSANTNFAFGPGTPYDNPSYIWTPNGPVYNNPAYNPFPTSGVALGTYFDTGIPGCTPAIYDQNVGWVAYTTPVNANAPLCNGRPAPAGIGPVAGTVYTTGAANCTPAGFSPSQGWFVSGNPTQGGAPLCDGNVYASVTGTGGAISAQMPNFTPTYTMASGSYAFRYVSAYEDATYRYYVYGR